MLVAIGITAVVLVAITLAATNSIRNARVSGERSDARVAAQAVLESIRSTRDSDPTTFFSQSTHTENLAEVGDNPVYSRQVEYTVEEPGKILVTVTVTWPDGDKTLSVTQSTYLNQWQ